MNVTHELKLNIVQTQPDYCVYNFLLGRDTNCQKSSAETINSKARQEKGYRIREMRNESIKENVEGTTKAKTPFEQHEFG